ncbi:GNAT family N-acetyltransferase, partial [Patescibacteria group bacterium]|nr:GNAT family N-acetyltransferase [Patescibacteria group bacterium]
DLESRIEEFKTNLPNLISPCLGQERSEALIQEIDQKVAMQFNHFDSDRTDLANLFSERGDKETEQLESRPMSIFVWARNPDIDLYQGNYSPCCICIDSAHMGAESTIADYNTDLGIQIVNIWDETKNEPVTAAWCWLGQNNKGEKALVIDNIESNTLYSSNFSEQLSNELLEYIKDYARKIGADKVVLGKANNDLPTGSELAKLSEDNGQYEKIGGSNRIDGYFLEAQEKSVKLVWQAEEKKVIEKKVKEIPKVEFKNLKVESISDKNLARVLQTERKIYAGTGLISGQTMVEDIKRGNGFEYSVAMRGIRSGKKQAEIVAYIIGVEDETDEGDKSIYMEDIAVLPEAQRQGIGWEAMKEFIGKLKAKATKDGQPVLLDMHLRETSQAFMSRYQADLENLGVKLIEEALVPDYYDEGEDSLYRVYEVRVD